MAVTPPYVSSRHELLQRSLASELTREFDADSRFSYVNLGHAIDVHEPAHAVDGIHPTGLGSRLIAAQLADRVVGIVRAAAASHTR